MTFGGFKETSESMDNNEANIEKEDEPEKSEKPDKHSSFIDSLKVDMSPEEVKEYNAEHGYTDEVTERPKGGVEREKTLENEDSRWEAYDTPEENTEDTTNDSL